MKQVLTFILALFLLVQPFSRLWVYMAFKLNQDTIEKTLCVQRNMQNNTCHGHCQLQKRLDSSDQQEKKRSEQNQKDKFEELFCQNEFEFYFHSTYIPVKKTNNFPLSLGHPTSQFTEIFHPPQFLG